ncbi:pheST operon leader peptide PheM [Cedecea colo]|uniref:PheST operon leader peptide PheM n=1 Tax=Cedecea colo TaxID=2552946 RepID=A0ABX0VRD9_9ENTR|nr:pheST operon leader peptide PheM [Cedecea colo]
MLLFSVSFFTLAPDSGGFARKKRNEKQRRKPPVWRLFFCISFLFTDKLPR